MSRAEFADLYAADPADIEAVEHFARAHELTIVTTDPAQRTVQLTGTVQQMAAAFQVSLGVYHHPGGSYRGREGSIHVPPEVAEIIEGVYGLDDRPQAHPRLHFVQPRAADEGDALDPRWLWPAQVAEAYSFPLESASGQVIALIELGGGYTDTELDSYFARVQSPRPNVATVNVDGGSNAPGGHDDAEVLLDMEIAGAVALGASLVVYFAPASDRGFLDAVSSAVHDSVNNPRIVSISWGAAESWWTEQALSP